MCSAKTICPRPRILIGLLCLLAIAAHAGGDVQSCAAMRARKDISGRKFERWTVIRFIPDHGWLCRCECGNEKLVERQSLLLGTSRSCGCLRVEVSARKAFKHGAGVGGVLTPTYKVWRGMLNRCRNKNEPAYVDYGARGITVCQRWADYLNFLEDMGPRPSSKHSIERKDNNKGYEPGNCKWATAQEQANNRRSSRTITWKGKTQTLAQWERETGVDQDTLGMRLLRGWTVEDTMTKPLKGKHNAIQTIQTANQLSLL